MENVYCIYLMLFYSKEELNVVEMPLNRTEFGA